LRDSLLAASFDALAMWQRALMQQMNSAAWLQTLQQQQQQQRPNPAATHRRHHQNPTSSPPTPAHTLIVKGDASSPTRMTSTPRSDHHIVPPLVSGLPACLATADADPKPAHSYIGLIAMGILSTDDKKMVSRSRKQPVFKQYF
jgi:hypothetical protein